MDLLVFTVFPLEIGRRGKRLFSVYVGENITNLS
jgi:hypothetical protein